MITLQLDIAKTVGIAAVLLVVGDLVKKHVSVLERYFIPCPRGFAAQHHRLARLAFAAAPV